MRLTVLVLAFVTAVSAAIVPKKNELVGTWTLSRAVSRGEEINPARFLEVTRTFDDQFFVVKQGDKVLLRARYSIDVSTSPKRFDTEYLNGPQSGAVVHGIYKVSADELKICITLDGGAAPARFESLKGSKTALDFYERKE